MVNLGGDLVQLALDVNVAHRIGPEHLASDEAIHVELVLLTNVDLPIVVLVFDKFIGNFVFLLIFSTLFVQKLCSKFCLN